MYCRQDPDGDLVKSWCVFIVQVKIKENSFLSAADPVFCICPVDKRNGRDYIYLNTKEVSLSFYSNSFTMNLRQREQFLPTPALQVTSHHFCKTSNQTILKCGNFLGSFVFNLSESVARRRKRMNFICRKHFVWHYWGDERGDVKTRTQSEGPFTPLTAICQTSKTF